jgi:hypothetical protein
MSDTASTPSTSAEHPPSSAEPLADSFIDTLEAFVASRESKPETERTTPGTLLGFMEVSRYVLDDHAKTLTERDLNSFLASIAEFSLFEPSEEDRVGGLQSWYSLCDKDPKVGKEDRERLHTLHVQYQEFMKTQREDEAMQGAEREGGTPAAPEESVEGKKMKVAEMAMVTSTPR